MWRQAFLTLIGGHSLPARGIIVSDAWLVRFNASSSRSWRTFFYKVRDLLKRDSLFSLPLFLIVKVLQLIHRRFRIIVALYTLFMLSAYSLCCRRGLTSHRARPSLTRCHHCAACRSTCASLSCRFLFLYCMLSVSSFEKYYICSIWRDCIIYKEIKKLLNYPAFV
jgi:hypothetical protein